MITEFRGEYAFLSNFSPHGVLVPEISEIPFATAEHAFQSAKTVDPDARTFVACAPGPGEAKQRGRHVPLRPDWELVKRWVMLQVVMAKFEPGTQLAGLLAATEGSLVEGNTWGDTYWGAVAMRRGMYGPNEVVWAPSGSDDGSMWLIGQNWLGRCLMLAREVIR